MYTTSRGPGAELTDAVHEQLCNSRAGRRWERIARTHRLEVEALLAVHRDLADHAAHALALLAGAATRAGEPVDDATLDALRVVLDDLDRLGTFDLRRDAQALRDELADVRGYSLAEALAG